MNRLPEDQDDLEPEDLDEVGPGEPVEVELIERDGRPLLQFTHKGADGVVRFKLMSVL